MQYLLFINNAPDIDPAAPAERSHSTSRTG